MTKNLWKNTTFICMNHGSEVPHIPMEIKMGGKEIFYACPKYSPQNREPGEIACANHMYTQTAEAAINHFDSVIESGLKDGIDMNITNSVWSKGSVEFKVLEHNGNNLKIGVYNKLSGKERK